MRKSAVWMSMLAATLSYATPSYSVLPALLNNQPMPSLAPIVAQVSPAVVNISVSGKKVSRQRIPDALQFFWGFDMPSEQRQERAFQALGSGVIINAKQGYVITNAHVVADAEKIKISLHDGREVTAKKIGEDPQSDIALLQIKADNLTEIAFADSDGLRVGDFALAIGNPFGLGQTVTSGIISALGRSGLNADNFENFIQTDAAINSGNSGGALLNLQGELVGINTAILGAGTSGGNIGIGFSIPSNMVKNLAEQIIGFGEVRRGVLGITGRELSSDLAKTFGYDKQNGAFVNQVMPKSAAAEAGLKAGDIIVSLNGKAIQSFSQLRATVGTMGIGKNITLGIMRDGKAINVEVVLKKDTAIKADAAELHPALSGAELENSKSPQGVAVSALVLRSPAMRLGLEEGDVIIGLNRQRVSDVASLQAILQQKPEVLALNIQRGDASLYLVLR